MPPQTNTNSNQESEIKSLKTSSKSIVTIDFETYYDKDYSLKKITTEEYVRDSKFEVIGVAVKIDSEETKWCSGAKEEIRAFLTKFELHKHILIAHNMAFDGFILAHQFNIHPYKYADTMAMGKILHGVNEQVSLENLSKIYYAGIKGDEASRVMGKHRVDFTEEELARYAEYCICDVNLTWMLFNAMIEKMPVEELRLIDLTNRMYCQPKLIVDAGLLVVHLAYVKQVKEKLLENSGMERGTAMSNDKFATMLRMHGVEPPTKISPATGKSAYAFAKTDDGFKALLAHENSQVQLLAAARLGLKSTLEETRTQKFIGIASRGAFPFSVRYSGAAITHRWSGFDVNPQNLPRDSTLRRALMAPPGYRIVAGDLSSIELRIGLWLAEEDKQLELIREGWDLYKKSAEEISNVPYGQVDKDLRFVFKTVNLAAIYGVGYEKLWNTIKVKVPSKTINEVKDIVDTYRYLRGNLTRTWRQGGEVLHALLNRQSMEFGRGGLIKVTGEGLLKPNGMLLHYPDLQKVNHREWFYSVIDKKRVQLEKVYGAKVFQRCVQSLARDLIAWQMLRLDKRIQVVGTVHDEIIGIYEDKHSSTEIEQSMLQSMSEGPKWAEGIPLDADVGSAYRYGDI